MTKSKKWCVFLLCVAVFIGLFYLNGLMNIITGYAAKNLCSAVFISGRSPSSVEELDLNFSFIKFTKNTVDYKNKSVTSKFLWGESKSIYREGFGVTILRGDSKPSFINQKYPLKIDKNICADSIDWPMGNRLNEVTKSPKLDSIARSLVDRQEYNGTPFAFVVVHNGQLVAERYRNGFNKKSRLLSWSMGKSITNALVGILVDSGIVDINAPLPFEEWQNDGRSKITLNNLMQMQSGLQWNESYGSKSDVNIMLHEEQDMGLYAMNKSLTSIPGLIFKYSSGSTNIVCRYIKSLFSSDSAYYDLAMNKLFAKIGINNAVFEVDMSGTLIGSSYVYATARDYARFGLLYLNDGIFCGDTILPQGWVEYTSTPAVASAGEYGSFFWLNTEKKLPDVPTDMFSCNGHDGQQIYIIPSKSLVVVVLGYSPRPDNMVDFNRLLKDIIEIGIDN